MSKWVRKKRCTRCKRNLPASTNHYSVVSTTADRLSNRCKLCQAQDRAKEKYQVQPAISRRTVQVCRVCYNLPHRVEGEVCAVCGLQQREEPSQTVAEKDIT